MYVFHVCMPIYIYLKYLIEKFTLVFNTTDPFLEEL